MRTRTVTQPAAHTLQLTSTQLAGITPINHDDPFVADLVHAWTHPDYRTDLLVLEPHSLALIRVAWRAPVLALAPACNDPDQLLPVTMFVEQACDRLLISLLGDSLPWSERVAHRPTLTIDLTTITDRQDLIHLKIARLLVFRTPGSGEPERVIAVTDDGMPMVAHGSQHGIIDLVPAQASVAWAELVEAIYGGQSLAADR